MSRGRLLRSAAATAAALTLLIGATCAQADPVLGTGWGGGDIVTQGRDRNRAHYSSDLTGWGMCLLWDLPVGPSRSQPLIVRRDFGQGERVWLHHAASQYLVTIDLGQPGGRPESTTYHPPPGMEKVAYLHPFRGDPNYLKIVSAYTWLSPPSDHAVVEGDAEWKQLFQPHRSSLSHPVYWKDPQDPKKDFIIIASRDATVVGVRVHDHHNLGSVNIPHTELNLDFGVVAAPIIWNDDTVLVPATNGNIYTVTGYRTGNPKISNTTPVGNRLSSSPVMIGDTLFQGRDPGGIKAFKMVPRAGGSVDLQFRWELKTGLGVASSLATDGELVYLTDKNGTVQAVTPDKKTIWSADLRGWTNVAPAIGKDRIYAVLRWTAETGDKGIGAVAAVARYDGVYNGKKRKAGDILWRKLLEGQGNKPPEVIARNADGAEIVYTADTAGYVQAWEGETGAPADFTQAYALDADRPVTCSDWNDNAIEKTPSLPSSRVSLSKGEKAYRGYYSWDAIHGAGTQPSVAHRYLAMGMNTVNPGDGLAAGFLRVYRLFPPLQMMLKDIHGAGLPDVSPKQKVHITGKLQVSSEPGYDLPTPANVAIFWEGDPSSLIVHSLPVTGQGPEATIPIDFWVEAPEKDEGKLWVVANPHQTMRRLLSPNPALDIDPAWGPLRKRLAPGAARYEAALQKWPIFGAIAPMEQKTTPATHLQVLEFRVQPEQDVKVQCPDPAPNQVPYMGFSFEYTVQVPGSTPVPATITVTVNRVVMTSPGIRLQPGDSTLTGYSGILIPGPIDVSVTVVPDDPKLDPDLTNNACSFQTAADPPQPPPPPPPPDSDRSILTN